MKSLTDIPGIGTARAAALQSAGIVVPVDFVRFLPISYRDARYTTDIAQLTPGQPAACEVVISGRASTRYSTRGHIVSVPVSDDTGTMALMWFNQPWREHTLHNGARMRIYGRFQRGESFRGMVQPQLNVAPDIEPIYRAIESVPVAILRKSILHVVTQSQSLIEEIFPPDFRERYDLIDVHSAYRAVHNPDDPDELARAKRRLSFEELFLYNIALSAARGIGTGGCVIPIDREEIEAYWETLPFKPTVGQRGALFDIVADLCAGSGVSRLIQGDVGSGKTAIAFGAMLLCARHGYQSALMAPTEILAQQHYESAQITLEPLNVKCALLTGSTSAKSRKEVLSALKSGAIDAIFGTHALFSEGVVYANLGLAITDEQHRFGVKQRMSLIDKGVSPHVVVLSATPIPRTLALVMYGDMNVSLMRDMPKGRLPVITRIVKENKYGDLLKYINARARQGQQTYVVCPLVEDSEMLNADSAHAVYERLKKELAHASVGLVHGRMSADEKARTLSAFRGGETDVLVSTTVIEVGVNVPNASVMIIQNPERFGLAQLHQLRGRVGRSDQQSYCFLAGDANERLSFFCKNHDGFALAEKDLELRGPGQMLGQRQHGLPELSAGALATDIKVLDEARRAAMEILQMPKERDVYLAHAQSVYGAYLDGRMIH